MMAHPYGKVVMEIPDGKWYWDEEFGDVSFVPRYARRPSATFHMRKANTETNALRMICHRMLGATSGNRNGDHVK